MDQQISKKLLSDYYAGHATPQQKRRIELWLNSSPKNQDLFFKWLEEWQRKNYEYQFDAKGEFALLKERILTYESQSDQNSLMTGRGKKSNFSLQGWTKLAAVFLLLIIATGTYYLLQPQLTYITYQTDYGQVKTITLPDQSIVRLNANSNIKYLKKWDANGPREVWLEGEAFFSVIHKDNHQKFLVHSADIEVEVLGTEFNVNSRHDATRIVLNSGSVKLNLLVDEGEESMVMVPGELVEYAQGSIKKKTVDPQLHTSWRNNKLIFDKTPVTEVLQLIEDNYGLEVVLEGFDLHGQTFSAILPANDVDVLLKALSKSFQLRLQRKETHIILKSTQ